MFEDVIRGLSPYVKKGFLDSVEAFPEVGPEAFVVKSGAEASIVNATKDGIEVNFGDNRAAVLSHISPDNAVRFIVQSLGRATFHLPVGLVASFRANPYPSEFKDAVLGPVGITSGERDGQFYAVYKDARGKFYIHEDEARVSLMLYKELYDRNSEGEMLGLAKLFSSDTPPVLTRAYSMISERTASVALSKIPLLSYAECAARGVPVRISSACLPENGAVKIGESNVSVSALGKSLLDMALTWESTLTGHIPQRPQPPLFSSAKVDVAAVVKSSKRTQVTCELSRQTPVGLVTQSFSLVMPGQEAIDFINLFDANCESTKPEVIAEAAKKLSPVAQDLEEGRYPQIASSYTAELSEATDKSFLIKSSASEKPEALDKFIESAKVPAWLAGASAFSAMQVK